MPNPLKIPESTSLAFHAMAFLASRPDESVSNRVMAERFDASAAHLAKVMGRLSRAGFVNSSTGPGGGFRLADNPDNISLEEIYEAVEGPLEPVGCLFGDPICDGDGCVFNGKLATVDEALREWMRSTTLRDLSGVFMAKTA